MRILHFYRTYSQSYGGIEQVIYQLCVGAQRLGAEPEVLTLARDRRAAEVNVDGHRVVQVPLDFEIASTGFSRAAFGKFRQLANQADIIHYHFPWPFMDVVHFACGIPRLGKPTVVSYHADIVRQKLLLQLYRPLMQRFLGSVDRIVASSPNYLATSPVLTQFRDKVTVIPYGLDRNGPNYPAPAAARLDAWRQRLGGKFFLFVGVLRYYKGLHVLLDAARACDYPIVIVGAGPVEAALKAQAELNRLRNVIFLGVLPDEDKVALLTLCHAVVFPSHLRSESFGISLLEGAMFGKPMISCEIGSGTSYINIDGETGRVVPPGDPAAFRQAMDFLWQHPAEAAAMGHRAAARYEALFTAERMSAGYLALYRELLAAR
ncbi:Glycosyltransferase [Sterolibacterium denitrificans]|uniref:Glycosyltransferase n=1 Tax=Sterolibacterium denitrificans TaxID=157592 RepID=A0A7Z7MUB9_9PROT|nr:glycosyltransferase family 4 protein [Sterolibacterium denitrificans]SMB22464.1 Glycosyltransferase [Sterolibacterium denitrificans]